MASKIAVKIGLSLEMLSSLSALKREQTITEDVFIAIGDWYHFAILELIKTQNFKSDISIIAKRLSISLEEATQAIKRLQRLEFIEVEKSSGVISLHKTDNSWLQYHNTSESRKNLQKQLLLKALNAVDNVEFKQRINMSSTVAINTSNLAPYQKACEKFINKINGLDSSLNDQNEVYQLCIAFYPLTTGDSL